MTADENTDFTKQYRVSVWTSRNREIYRSAVFTDFDKAKEFSLILSFGSMDKATTSTVKTLNGKMVFRTAFPGYVL